MLAFFSGCWHHRAPVNLRMYTQSPLNLKRSRRTVVSCLFTLACRSEDHFDSFNHTVAEWLTRHNATLPPLLTGETKEGDEESAEECASSEAAGEAAGEGGCCIDSPMAICNEGADGSCLRDGADDKGGDSLAPTPPPTPPGHASCAQGCWQSGENVALHASAAAATTAVDGGDKALREALAMLQRDAAARLEALFVDVALALRCILDPLAACQVAATTSNMATAAVTTTAIPVACVGENLLGAVTLPPRAECKEEKCKEEKFRWSDGASGYYDGTAAAEALPLPGPNADVAQLKEAVQRQNELRGNEVRKVCFA